MNARLTVFPMWCAIVLGLPAVAVGQDSPPRASQPDSSGRAFLDDSTGAPVTRSFVPSDMDRPSLVRTIEPAYCQILAGAYFSGRPGPEIPAFNYLPLTVRYGWELGGRESETLLGMWRNTDFIVDLTGALIISDYGTVLGGPKFHFRKNFAAPGSEVIPYCQIGFGFILNDAYHDQSQRALGHFFEFTEHAEVGLKWMVAPDLSLDVALAAQHISNAGLANRNLGVNAFGGQIGLTYYFSGGRNR